MRSTRRKRRREREGVEYERWYKWRGVLGGASGGGGVKLEEVRKFRSRNKRMMKRR